MAVENLSSQVISNASSTPVVHSNANVAGGLVKEGSGSVVPSATASAASTYKFCRVPSNCRISQILLSNAAFTAGAMDIGIFETFENGGAVVSQALFGSAVSLAAANSNLDVTQESGTYTIAQQEQMLWQALGLSSDPCKEYVVGATVTTGFTGGTGINLKARYAV